MGEPQKVKVWQVRWTAAGEAVPAFLVSHEAEVQPDGQLRLIGALGAETLEDLARRHGWHPTKRAAALAYLERRQKQVDEHLVLLGEAQDLARAAGALSVERKKAKARRRKRRAS